MYKGLSLYAVSGFFLQQNHILYTNQRYMLVLVFAYDWCETQSKVFKTPKRTISYTQISVIANYYFIHQLIRYLVLYPLAIDKILEKQDKDRHDDIKVCLFIYSCMSTTVDLTKFRHGAREILALLERTRAAIRVGHLRKDVAG